MKENGADKLEEGEGPGGGAGAFCSENKRDSTLEKQ
jgi:hypothetical protein